MTVLTSEFKKQKITISCCKTYFYNKSNNEKTEIAALCKQTMTKKWTHQHYGGFLHVFLTLFEAKTVDCVLGQKRTIWEKKKRRPLNKKFLKPSNETEKNKDDWIIALRQYQCDSKRPTTSQIQMSDRMFRLNFDLINDRSILFQFQKNQMKATSKIQ